jgi:hypothetical protein
MEIAADREMDAEKRVGKRKLSRDADAEMQREATPCCT